MFTVYVSSVASASWSSGLQRPSCRLGLRYLMWSVRVTGSVIDRFASCFIAD